MFKELAKPIKLFGSLAVTLGLLFGIGVADANAVITINGDYTGALHIKTIGRLNAVSLGIGYPGDTWRSDCAALDGDAVKIPATGLSTRVWLSARDLRTSVKGYSSAAYMFRSAADAVKMSDSRYPKRHGDVCRTPDNWQF
ncbi:MAG: hypothetical protein LBI63_02350 [Candidatus Ancillula sp.]|jgi:hypothetical protein|nr:hypothetical protein [Candidatus Ancillula sp.]